jgi:hypothetical protein
MTHAKLLVSLFALCLPLLLMGQQPADMTGAWRLDVASSSWGNAHRPLTVMMDIDHQEPVLRYSGSILYASEDTRQFAFDGRIDGREYFMERSFGAGRIVLRRLSPNSIRSVFRTNDSQYTETAVTTVSRDGRRLTRRIHVTGPAGDTHWTESYVRR